MLTTLALDARLLILSLLDEKRDWSCSSVHPQASMALMDSRAGFMYRSLDCYGRQNEKGEPDKFMLGTYQQATQKKS